MIITKVFMQLCRGFISGAYIALMSHIVA